MVNGSNDAQVLNLIKTHDSEYISMKENENKCVYEFNILEFHPKDSNFIKGLVLSWDIPIDNYYVVIGNPNNEYKDADGYELNYLVSTSNKTVIIMPHQGGLDAYKIKNNKKSAIYPYLREESSYKWR